ncbi:MerR family transcriptional regulator [Allomesorhizobium alhagi]|jgi:DNA-binding transcriptional MerR regulator|uniref:MerR family transcriptional regulator n=1 Tax=Mesorhizobium alhagi CCNWXJ12-2 TaxID=1107882 RepID=H0HZY3_9HYPH|nr:helix-turn-helix domain-containing protein [Mesorhizobium alhagi]EHK53736.1 MerR family transcriptional regulator [Mesorhizobium alhagi CCNWXJ12-2]
MEFSIGELARRTRVKVPTIRYYEQIGLLPSPPRTEGKQRRYEASDASRLNFIRHARELGFEVDAIRELLALSAKPNQPCADIDDIARRHIGEIDQRIAHLVSLRAELQRTVDECGRGRVCECRVIETLADSSHYHERLAAV